MKRFAVTSRYGEPLVRLAWQGGALIVEFVASDLIQSVARWTTRGVHWSEDGDPDEHGPTMRIRKAMPSDPMFLDGLHEYLARQFNFVYSLTEEP